MTNPQNAPTAPWPATMRDTTLDRLLQPLCDFTPEVGRLSVAEKPSIICSTVINNKCGPSGMHSDSGFAARQPPCRVVLDTNVVLDWLVFDDARVQRLGQALALAQLLWLTTEPMLAELTDVLTRPFVTPWCNDPAAVLAQARSLCHIVPTPVMAPDKAPVCGDPDDQQFIDLAWSVPAVWLFTRDRALLALAARARARGVVITTPQAWLGLPPAA